MSLILPPATRLTTVSITLSLVLISGDGGGLGLAVDPTTGQLWALLHHEEGIH